MCYNAVSYMQNGKKTEIKYNCTPKEIKIIDNNASDAGLKRATWARQAALKYRYENGKE